MAGEQCERARVAAGSVAPTPLRLKPVESLLEGEALTPALLARARALAAESVSPIDDIRCSAAYRRLYSEIVAMAPAPYGFGAKSPH